MSAGETSRPSAVKLRVHKYNLIKDKWVSQNWHNMPLTQADTLKNEPILCTGNINSSQAMFR